MNRRIIKIRLNECKGCGRCVAVCPLKLLTFSDKLNDFSLPYVEAVTPERCLGCGKCFYSCPEPGAIRITEES